MMRYCLGPCQPVDNQRDDRRYRARLQFQRQTLPRAKHAFAIIFFCRSLAPDLWFYFDRDTYLNRLPYFIHIAVGYRYATVRPIKLLREPR